MPIKILVLNGPNLNMLGRRNIAVYGSLTLEQIIHDLQKCAESLGCEIVAQQHNDEASLIERLQRAADNSFSGVVFNPGGYTHTSIALRDAVEIARDLGVATIEIHISDISKREDFRRISLLSTEPSVVIDTVMGYGAMGYSIALTKLTHYIAAHATDQK